MMLRSQEIMGIFKLLPTYLIVLTILLIILPTLVGILARFFLYQHLNSSSKRTRYLLEGRSIEQKPSAIAKIEQRFSTFAPNIEEVNTPTIVLGIYNQEKCRILGLPFSCDAVAYFTRLLPNLLLSFGLLGTFLGITINLTNLSGTITQADITDIGNLLSALDQPLQGMGIAFITSLMAISCSALLAVLNLVWNTNLAKSKLLNFLEDYADHFCLPALNLNNPLEMVIERFNDSCDRMITDLGLSIETAVTNAFSKVERSADSFVKAAETLDQSHFPQQLANATNDLAIAQNNFSQSSLVLQRSTQSFEHSLDGVNKAIRYVATIKQDLSRLSQQQNLLNTSEQKELHQIQQQIERLIKASQQNSI